MSAQGYRMEGVQVGDLTPLDIPGTKCWLQNDAGVVFQRTNNLKSWTDSTPYQIMFTGADTLGNPRASAGAMYQVGNRLGYAAFGGDSWLQALNTPPSHWNFLVNGSPYTFICLYQILNADNTGSATVVRNVPGVQPGFSHGQGSNITSRHLNANNVSMYALDISAAAANLVVGQKVLYTETNYGYGSGAVPLTFNTLDGISPRTQLNAYTVAPDPAAVYGSYMGIFPSSKRYLFEKIYFDHTGKTKAQIDFEMSNIITNYVKKKYPDF